MIEPIGSGDNKISPYDRYSQYQQYSRPEGAGKSRILREGQPIGQTQGHNMTPGQTGTPNRIMPPGYAGQASQNTPPEQTAQQKQGSAENVTAVAGRECQTCKNRRYQDRSDDPGVSYQTPAKIDPGSAGTAVRAHENEHVSREQSKADRQGREVISQSVILKTAICPECGKVYISGGATTTVTRARDTNNPYQTGAPADSGGLFLNENA